MFCYVIFIYWLVLELEFDFCECKGEESVVVMIKCKLKDCMLIFID